MTVNIIIAGGGGGHGNSGGDGCQSNGSVTYSVVRPIRSIFTTNPANPSLIFQESSSRKMIIFKSSVTNTGRFKIVAYSRSFGFPAEFNAAYEDINNELFGEILPGGNMVLDGDLVKSDLYAFSSADSEVLQISIVESRSHLYKLQPWQLSGSGG